MVTLHQSLEACFSPAEFLGDVLMATTMGTSVLPSLRPGETVAPLTWFGESIAACDRHGLLCEPEFWTAAQRARPAHCGELHRFRRLYVAREREPPAPRASALDAAVVTLASRFAAPAGIIEVFRAAGWRATPPPAGSSASLLHWALIALVRASDGATLFRFARLVQRIDPGLGEVAAILDRLAICACDGEVPSALRGPWLDVQPGQRATDLSFRSWEPPAAHDGAVPIDPRPVERALAAGLSLRVFVDPSSHAVELQLRAHCDGPWLGQTLRLCHGVHTLLRRLISAGGDRLGDFDGEILVLLESLEPVKAP